MSTKKEAAIIIITHALFSKLRALLRNIFFANICVLIVIYVN